MYLPKFYTSLLFCILTTSLLFAQNKMDNVVNQFVLSAGFENASIGIYAVDTKTNEPIMLYDEKRLLTPASTTKLFSTALAIDVLGGSYQPNTQLYYSGTIEGATLTGDIWIVGGGDMSLGSRYFDKSKRLNFFNNWVKKIQELGISEIKGNIIIDGSKFGYQGVPDDWLWGDMGNYYGAPFTGVMIYDNMLEYHFKTKETGTQSELIYTIPQQDQLYFSNKIVSSEKLGDNSYIFGAPYSFVREGRGELPKNKSDFMVKGSLPYPEQQLGSDFIKSLNERDVIVDGTVITTMDEKRILPASSQLIVDYKGQSIKELAKVTNFESVNVFAEGLMRITAYEKTGKGSHDDAIRYLTNYWKEKLGSTPFYINDGSGLSRSTAITAKTMTELLVYMSRSKNGLMFYQTLPVSGKSGTIQSLTKNQVGEGRVHAKSGTMRRVKSYAGYVETKSGRQIAFAFIINNYTCSNSAVNKQMELLMNALSEQ